MNIRCTYDVCEWGDEFDIGTGGRGGEGPFWKSYVLFPSTEPIVPRSLLL